MATSSRSIKSKANDVKGQSPGREVWERLRHRPTAVIAMIGIAILLFLAIFADLLYPYEMAIEQVATEKLMPPGSPGHLLGTDNLGRDLMARIVHGARTALLIGVSSSLLSIIVSTILASLCAIFGGTVDNIIMRIKDVISCLPSLVVALAICAALGNGIPQLIVALAFSGISFHTTMIRSVALRVAKMDYLESAVALGGRPGYIMRRHLVPNLASIIIINASQQVSTSIMMGATLGFIGLGVKAPTPEWGTMLSEGLNFILRNQYMVLVPGIALCLASLFINTFGDCLRDAFDPQLKGKS